MLALAQKNPFGVFSQDSIAKLSALDAKMQEFSGNLKMVAFDISKIPNEAARSIAETTNNVSVNLDELVSKLNSLRTEFQYFGLSDVERIRTIENEKLEVLRQSFENQLIQEQEFNMLQKQVRESALQQIAEIEKRENEKRTKSLQENQNRINSIVNSGFANAISGGIQNVIGSLAKGENVFKNFASFIVSTFGDLAIQLGQFYIAQGLANLALLKLDPTATIATGASLVALGAILKSFAGGGLGGATSGVAPVGAQAAPGQLETTPTELADPETARQAEERTVLNLNIEGSMVRESEASSWITSLLEESGKTNSNLIPSLKTGIA
jgi:hypothetical protein